MTKITPFLWFDKQAEEAVDVLIEMMGDPDPVKAERVTRAMLQMKKLDIETLTKAYRQG